MRKLMTLVVVTALCVGLVNVHPVKAEVAFKPASAAPAPGLKMMTSAAGSFYVASDAVLTGADVQGAESLQRGTALSLIVGSDAAARVARSMAGTDRLAIIVDGILVDAPRVRASAGDGRVVLRDLSVARGEHLDNVLSHTSVTGNAPVITLRPISNIVQADGMFTVEVFVRNVVDLKAFQVNVQATSASTGRLMPSAANIDSDRADYAFTGVGETIAGANVYRGIVGGVAIDGSVTTTEERYLGTFHFQVPDASTDTFFVNVSVTTETFLANSKTERSSYKIASPVMIATSTPAQIRGRPARTRK